MDDARASAGNIQGLENPEMIANGVTHIVFCVDVQFGHSFLPTGGETMAAETSLLEKLDLWKQFKSKAEGNGFSTNDALVRLMRRYLARGFDDGTPETK